MENTFYKRFFGNDHSSLKKSSICQHFFFTASISILNLYPFLNGYNRFYPKETIIQNLPVLVNLKAVDHHTLPKMGDKSFAFVSKAFEYAVQNPKVIPAFLDMAEFEKDTLGTAELKKVLIPLH